MPISVHSKGKNMKKLLLILIFIPLLTGCGKKAEVFPQSLMVSMSTYDQYYSDNIVLRSFSEMVKNGFNQGLSEADLNSIEIISCDNHSSSEELVKEINGVLYKNDILMSVGSATNMSTMYEASLSDYYEIPMLIPFVEGDFIVDEEESSWLFRTTPTALDYAEFVNKSILTPQTIDKINNRLFADKPVKDFTVNVGFLVSDSNLGHAGATDIAQNVMDNGMNIDFYEVFKDAEIYSHFEKAFKEKPETMRDLDVIFIIGEIIDIGSGKANINSLWEPYGKTPVIICFGNSFKNINDEIQKYGGLYDLMMKLDYSGNCPILEYDSYFYPLGYGSGQLVGKVLKSAAEKVPEYKYKPNPFSFKNNKDLYHDDYRAQYRQIIRDELLNFNGDVPCLGHVSFSSNGQRNNIPITLFYCEDSSEGIPGRIDPADYHEIDADTIFEQILTAVSQDLERK